MHVLSVLWLFIALAGMSAHAAPAPRPALEGPMRNEARADTPQGLSPSRYLPRALRAASSASTVHAPSTLFPPSVTTLLTAESATPTPSDFQPPSSSLPVTKAQTSPEEDLEARKRRKKKKPSKSVTTSWPAAAVTGSSPSHNQGLCNEHPFVCIDPNRAKAFG
ncbi:hypothetical protein DENSPDRAFT_852929 [Dentipellis sp. KUC8613]|nr:hypothetical protein DENSPDRAFT_852929 [Dentipellis sp. KUC8613]